MMTLQNGNQILPNWKLHFEEVSNNVYNVELTDNFGRQASTTDHDIERALNTCEGYAFDIEKQISKNWGRFLFDYSILKLSGKSVTEQKYHKEVFGSWYIVCNSKRLIYDGRDHILIVQDYKQTDADWTQYKAISITDLTFDKYKEFVSYLN